MRIAHLYLGAVLLLHIVVAILYEAHFWNYTPDGGPEGDWMTSPAIYWSPLLVLIFLWIRADAKDRHVVLSPWLSFAIPLLFPLGVPFYYFRTNQPLRAFQRSAMFLLFVAACLAALRLGNLLAFNYYAIWTNR
jgi:hypothetical protein